MELHEDQRDDSVLFLQEHAVHHPPVHLRIFLRVFRPDTIRRRLHRPVQPDLHRTTRSRARSPLARRQLHVQGETNLRVIPPHRRQEHEGTVKPPA